MRRLAPLVTALLLAPGAGAVQIFFEHGIGADNTVFGFTPQTPGVCSGPLCDMLKPGNNLWANDYNSTVNGVRQLDTFNQSIPQQGDRLINTVRSRSSNQPFILIGSSQGGLRSRYAVQKTADGTMQNNARAIVTFDSPHAGAPIVSNLPAFKRDIDLKLRLGTFGFFTLDQVINSVAPNKDDLGNALLMNGTEPGLVDMTPGGDFVSMLNGQVCRNETRTWLRMPKGGRVGTFEGEWEPIEVAETTVICSVHPNFRPLPASVNVISVYGEGISPIDSNVKNSVEAALPPDQAQKMRSEMQRVASLASTAGWLLWVTPTGKLQGDMLLDLANTFRNFNEVWRTKVVGSVEGDGVVPKQSQLYLQENTFIGGTRPVGAIRSGNWHSTTQKDPSAVDQVYSALARYGSLR